MVGGPDLNFWGGPCNFFTYLNGNLLIFYSCYEQLGHFSVVLACIKIMLGLMNDDIITCF